MFEGSKFSFSDAQIEKWSHVYPGVHILIELNKMEEWILAKRAERKNWRLFVVRWLSSAHTKLLQSEVSARVREAARDAERRREARVGLGLSCEGVTLKPEAIERLRARGVIR